MCCSRVSPGSGVCREPYVREKCSLRVELLPGETIESDSCVCVAGDSEGEDRVSLALKRASDA